MEELHYKIPGRSAGAHPGYHRGRYSGGGYEFRGHVPLADAPDPRRLDMRASLRDPLQRLLVRVHSQNTAIPVYALADLSASMGFGRKPTILADFMASLAYSAYRTGDPFGFVGCDRAIREELLQPLTHNKLAGHDLAARLRKLENRGPSASGLLRAVERLGRQRALVFLASDFLFDEALLAALLGALGRHLLVPVVIWDSREYLGLPQSGLVRLRDSESGRERTLFMRRALRNRIRRDFDRWRTTLVTRCTAVGAPPLTMVDRFRAEHVTRYFYQ